MPENSWLCLVVTSRVAPAVAADVRWVTSIRVVAVCREDLDQCGDQREVLVLGVVRIRPERWDGQVGQVPIVAADGQRVIDQLDESGQGGPRAAT